MKTLPFFQVLSNPDTTILMTLQVVPGADNTAVIDAAFAVLEDLIGVNAVDGPELAAPPKGAQ